MRTDEVADNLRTLFSELTEGATSPPGGFVLNSGDIGLVRSLGALDAAAASRASQGGATIAAHAEHVRYGLSLMNRWALHGGNPFADATWDAAWQTAAVSDAEWRTIIGGLEQEARQWLDTLAKPREVKPIELTGMIASIAHVAYHLGAIRQISVSARGPREGSYP